MQSSKSRAGGENKQHEPSGRSGNRTTEPKQKEEEISSDSDDSDNEVPVFKPPPPWYVRLRDVLCCKKGPTLSDYGLSIEEQERILLLSPFSDSELVRLMETFSAMDSSGDGSISRTALLYTPELAFCPFKDQAFKVLAKSSPKKMSFGDFALAFKVFSELAPKRDKMRFLFDVYDIDGDDFVSFEDLCGTLHLLFDSAEVEEHHGFDALGGLNAFHTLTDLRHRLKSKEELKKERKAKKKADREAAERKAAEKKQKEDLRKVREAARQKRRADRRRQARKDGQDPESVVDSDSNDDEETVRNKIITRIATITFSELNKGAEAKISFEEFQRATGFSNIVAKVRLYE